MKRRLVTTGMAVDCYSMIPLVIKEDEVLLGLWVWKRTGENWCIGRRERWENQRRRW